MRSAELWAKTCSDQWELLIRRTEMLLTQGVDNPEMSQRYVAMLNELQHDRIATNGDVELGLMNAPASQSRHHNYQGGLVKHILEMWDLWTGLSHVIRAHTGLVSYLQDSSFVWRAILHHDLNKVWKYKLVEADPWKVDYADDSWTALLSDTHKSIYFLNKHDIFLPMVLHAALITAEGGFSAARPKAEPVFSKVIYLLDELSANVVDRMQNGRFWDSKVGGISAIS